MFDISGTNLNPSLAGHWRISIGVPSATARNSQSISGLVSAMQPAVQS